MTGAEDALARDLVKTIEANEYLGAESVLLHLAILHERIFFFKQDHKRNQALSLILYGDLCWQVLKGFAGIRENGLAWIQEQHICSQNSHKDLFCRFNSIFHLHTALRHPANLNNYPFMFKDPWPADEAARLIENCESLRQVLRHIQSHFHDGYSGDE